MDRIKLCFMLLLFSMSLILIAALVYASLEVHIQNINLKYQINQIGSLLAHLTTELSNKEAEILALQSQINATCSWFFTIFLFPFLFLQSMGKKVSDDGIKKVVKMGSRGRVVIPNKFRRAIRMEQQVLIILDEKNKEIRIKPSVYKQMKLNELK
jgi:hypothetical protein